ncbi:MAG: hypothetical protein M5U28_18140 [Sandaracinaceae bacterium]|nr:hypothetical protein [Sandaracinaceae bacterium]
MVQLLAAVVDEAPLVAEVLARGALNTGGSVISCTATTGASSSRMAAKAPRT